MAEKRSTFLEALFAPKVVKIGALVWLLFAGYDTLCSQFDLPTIGTLVGKVNGSLLPWWGWLLILQAILVYALFEYVRRNVNAPTPPGPNPHESINARVKEEVRRLRERVKKLEGGTTDPALAPASVSYTAKEKGQAKDILVDLASLARHNWVPLFESARWMHGAQDVYLANLNTLPALKEQANQVAREIQRFQSQHDHMLTIMGLNLDGLAQAAFGTEGPIRHYINRVSALGALTGLSDGAIQLLQSDAEPVRNSFALYDHALSLLQNTVTRMRKEIDA